VHDDRLRLIFTCCHPALAPEAQIALTLRLLGGLTTGEVARAFVVAEATMAKRLTRAKHKIEATRVPYPSIRALPRTRCSATCHLGEQRVRGGAPDESEVTHGAGESRAGQSGPCHAADAARSATWGSSACAAGPRMSPR